MDQDKRYLGATERPDPRMELDIDLGCTIEIWYPEVKEWVSYALEGLLHPDAMAMIRKSQVFRIAFWGQTLEPRVVPQPGDPKQADCTRADATPGSETVTQDSIT